MAAGRATQQPFNVGQRSLQGEVARGFSAGGDERCAAWANPGKIELRQPAFVKGAEELVNRVGPALNAVRDFHMTHR